VIQARNEADTVIYQAEKSLRDLGDKVAQPIGTGRNEDRRVEVGDEW